jgi:hypothetical protein
MKNLATIALLMASIASFIYGLAPANAPSAVWLPASRSNLCVTEGVIKDASDNQLSVDVPKMRAYVNRSTEQTIEARLTYLGPTSVQAPLGSGEMRQQFGLKLHAQDACNLVYAIWRFEPESKLVVSVKSNPGEHTSAECGNRGYRNITADTSSPVPAVQPSQTHTLRAEMAGAELTVFVDDTQVWEGNVGAAATALSGPVGIRSDNARLELEVRARQSDGPHPNYVLRCKAEAGDSD